MNEGAPSGQAPWQLRARQQKRTDSPPFLALRTCLAPHRWFARRSQVSEAPPTCQPAPPHNVRYRPGRKARDCQEPLVLRFGPWRTTPFTQLAASCRHHATPASAIRGPDRWRKGAMRSMNHSESTFRRSMSYGCSRRRSRTASSVMSQLSPPCSGLRSVRR